MKKLNILSAGFVALALAVTACGSDDETGGGDGDGDGDGDTGGTTGDGDGDTGGGTGDGDGDIGGDAGDGDMGGGTGDGDMTPDLGDLSITLTGFAPHDGDEYGVRVTDSSDEQVFIETGESFDPGVGSQELTETGVIEADETFTIQVWMDFSGDGTCGEGDHVWIFEDEEPNTDGNLVFEYTHLPADIEIECDGF